MPVTNAMVSEEAASMSLWIVRLGCCLSYLVQLGRFVRAIYNIFND